MHGELVEEDKEVVPACGSSPRAWGTQISVLRALLQARFIPTCMGNSLPFSPWPKRLPVHPHVHGELGSNRGNCPRNGGSSPRAWGTHSIVACLMPSFRFIPTCMGNSLPFSPWPKRLPVHPHVHGELTLPSVVNFFTTGSSPRAWGTHRYSTNIACHTRFIPTCMGNSVLISVMG